MKAWEIRRVVMKYRDNIVVVCAGRTLCLCKCVCLTHYFQFCFCDSYGAFVCACGEVCALI